MLQASTLKFLRDLARNNNKSWFDSHRSQYTAAREDFENLVDTILAIHKRQDPDLEGLTAKQCVFRINRDIRFSKDKSPYKTNMGASMDRGGKKSRFAGYYLHCEPGKSFVGGGLWMPSTADARKVRQEIDYCWDEFESITNNKKFKQAYGAVYRGDDVSLTRTPQGFENDSPAAEYLRLKSWLAMKELSDEEIQSKNLAKQITEQFLILMPFIKFLNRAVEDTES